MGCTPSKPVDVQLLDALPKKPNHNNKEQANAAPPSKPPPLISASSKLPLAEAELKQQLAVARREALDAVAQAEKYKADADAARRQRAWVHVPSLPSLASKTCIMATGPSAVSAAPAMLNGCHIIEMRKHRNLNTPPVSCRTV